MSTIDINLDSICQQRRQSLLYTIPPNRYTPVNIYNAYPEFTKSQFDMRRKAEILLYNPSSSSTQTNSITKTEKFTQLITGKNKTQSYNDIFLQQMDVCGNFTQLVIKYPDSYSSVQVKYSQDTRSNPLYRTVYTVIPNGRVLPTCDTNLIPQPTSSSNVPGPIMYLVKDPAVPLYNYSTKSNAYGIINTQPIAPWNTFTTDNIQFYNSISKKLFTLVINPTIQDYAYNFSFKTPIYLYFNGIPSQPISNENRTLVNQISIYDIEVIPTYSGKNAVLQKPINKTPVSHFSTTEFTLDIVNGSLIKPFSGGIYLGMLNIDNLYLYTQAGYVYDINVTFTLTFTSIDGLYSSYFNNITSGIYCNMTNAPPTNNCNITTIPSIEQNTGFLFLGS